MKGYRRDTGGAGDPGRGLLWLGTAALVVLPTLVVRAIDATRWLLPQDAIFLGGIVLGVGLAYEIARRVPDRFAAFAGFGLAGWAALLCIWINLAVGIIGSEDNPANLIYVAVLAVAGLGTLIARFRARGMVQAMMAAAAAQLAAFLAALLMGFGFTGPITVFFGGLWLIAAWLFRRAADRHADGAARA